MTEHDVVCKIKGYIQPFERRLALMELEAIAGSAPAPDPSLLSEPQVFRVKTNRSIDHLADTLTYWEAVALDGIVVRHTRQVLREAAATVVRNGITPAELGALLPWPEQAVPLPNRRVLRYGPHGGHEYRGRFFPQLVRALLNVARVEPGDIVLDPMCGSGTTPLEAGMLGCKTFGVDMNPLSVLMSRAKCAIVKTPAQVLATEFESLRADLSRAASSPKGLSWLEHLPRNDQTYLASWFSSRCLAALDPIAIRVHATRDPACRDLFRLCLSNILRRISWQKTADLRIRKEVLPEAEVDVGAEFLAELGRTARAVLAFLYQERHLQPGPTHITEGDARRLTEPTGPLPQLRGSVKAIVTSPPYAMALPYLDTDRLSLCYLGLLPRSEHRGRDHAMIGNREITETTWRTYWLAYEQHRAGLPPDVGAIVDRVYEMNQTGDPGFRRRQLPALLARYFLDMQQVFRQVAEALEAGGRAFVVIGNNHTIANGHRIDIETDHLLCLIGQSAGLCLDYSIPMEMLVSRDIFKRNAVASETILGFHKGAA